MPGPKKRGALMSLPALARPSQTTCLNCPSRSQPGPEARKSLPEPWTLSASALAPSTHVTARARAGDLAGPGRSHVRPRRAPWPAAWPRRAPRPTETVTVPRTGVHSLSFMALGLPPSPTPQTPRPSGRDSDWAPAIRGPAAA